jgi:hypothetical protein
MRSINPVVCAIAVAVAAAWPARADTASANVAVFPLASGNQLFPTRNNRLSLKCFNPTTNAAVVVTYASGYAITMAPGASLWETIRPPQGKITATGTAGQTLACEDFYQ